MKTITWLLVVLFALPFQSCSFLAGALQTVTISADPAAAEIYVDDALVGSGTVVLALQRDSSHTVQARYEGRIVTSSIGTKMSTTALLDVVGGILFIVPLVGLLAPGSRTLTPTNIKLTIPPVDA